MRCSLVWIMFACCATLPACSGCGSKAPLEFVPHDSLVVVEVGSLAKSLRHVEQALQKLTSGDMLRRAVDAQRDLVKRELGIDPKDPRSLKKKGIDPRSGFVLCVSAEGVGALVVPVADEDELDKFVRAQLEKRFSGDLTIRSKKVKGMEVNLVTRQGERGSPVAGWGFAKKHLIAAFDKRGNHVGEHIAKLAKLDKNIKDNKVFKEVSDKLEKRDVLVYVDGSATRKALEHETELSLKDASKWRKQSIRERKEIAGGLLGYVRGAGLGVRVSADGLAVRGYLAAPPDKAKQFKRFLSGSGDSPSFGRYLGGDALLAGRAALDIKLVSDKLLQLLPPRQKREIYRELQRWERRNDLSVEKDILALFAGRLAGGLFPPPKEALEQMPSSPVEWLRMLPGVLMLQVKDAKKAADLLGRLERFLVMHQLDVRTRGNGKRKLYTLELHGRDSLRWTVEKKLILVGDPKRLQSTIERMRKGGDGFVDQVKSSRAKRLFSKADAAVIYQDVDKLASTLRALSLPAPLKLVIDSALGGVLSKFRDVLWALQAEDKGVLGELNIRLK